MSFLFVKNIYMPLPLLLLPTAITSTSLILTALATSKALVSSEKEQSDSSTVTEIKMITVGGIFGWILEGLRKEWEYTQTTMAYCLGLNSKNNYYKIEKSLTEIDINQLYYFCEKMNLPIVEVLVLHNKICETALQVNIEVVMDRKITTIDATKIITLSEYLNILDIAEARAIKRAFSALSDIPSNNLIREIKNLSSF